MESDLGLYLSASLSLPVSLPSLSKMDDIARDWRLAIKVKIRKLGATKSKLHPF